MFREIRRSEKITEKSAKQCYLDYLYHQLFDCVIGSDHWNQIRAQIDELEETKVESTYDPDARI